MYMGIRLGDDCCCCKLNSEGHAFAGLFSYQIFEKNEKDHTNGQLGEVKGYCKSIV